VEEAKLLRRDAEWADLATAGKDIDKIVSYWSDDAVVIFPGQPVIEGKQAIRAYVEASLKTPGFKIHWVSEKPVFSPTSAALTTSPCQVRTARRSRRIFEELRSGVLSRMGNGVAWWIFRTRSHLRGRNPNP
jgi:hypothetical protein